MGLLDRIRAWGSGGDQDAPIVRSPLEQRLIERLQDSIGDPLREDAPVRLHLRFTGEVQGVGFRWNSTWIARDFHLTGWVMNLDDGSVEMVVQGSPKRIIMHLDKLHAYYQRFRNRIWIEEATELSPVEDEAEFEARYEPGVM